MNTEYPNQHPHTAEYPNPAFYGPAPQEPTRRGGWSPRQKIVALAAATALALGAGGAGAAVGVAAVGVERSAQSPVAASGASTGSTTTAQVAAAVQPSVVSVTTDSGEGSGVVLRADGTIITNAHVVSGARQVSVKFSDGRTARAQVLGTDAAKDIAVLKAAGVSDLKPISFADSDTVQVGDAVLALGNPLGLSGSVTSGIVSALGREVKEGGGGSDENENLPPFLRQQLSQRQQGVIENAIQTDAAINPGNSGGALVDGAGRLIGINTAIATSGSGSGSIGVGFAIPSNTAKDVAEKIITNANV